MGSHRHLRFPSMSFIYKCSFRKPEWCFCFSRFGEESFFASTVTRLKPALSVFSIAIELKLIIACKGTDNKLVSQDGFHRTLTFISQVRNTSLSVWPKQFGITTVSVVLLSVLMLLFTAVCFTKGPRGVGLLLYGSLVTPLFEELLFRGHIYVLQLRVHRQTFHVIIVNALLFSVWHLGYIVNPLFCGEWMALSKLIIVLIYGLVLASIRSITKSTLCCVLVHGALNSFMG